MTFYDNWIKVFPNIKILEDNYEIIKNEIKNYTNEWVDWPEMKLSPNKKWKVIPLLYTFPNVEKKNMIWLSKFTQELPKLTSILKSIKGIRSAIVSKIGPSNILLKHQGWACLANYVLRVHLPIIVPQHKKCGLWCDKETRYLYEGKLKVFDDSKLHTAFNFSNKDRIVLIIDILRNSSPLKIPKGISNIKQTPQLLEAIKKYK